VGNTSLCLCIDADVLDKAIRELDLHEKSLGIRNFVFHPKVIVISIYPHKQRPRVAERLLTALRMDGVDPLSTNNASSVVSCVVNSEHVEQALASLANAFELP
jgi:aspartokinase